MKFSSCQNYLGGGGAKRYVCPQYFHGGTDPPPPPQDRRLWIQHMIQCLAFKTYLSFFNLLVSINSRVVPLSVNECLPWQFWNKCFVMLGSHCRAICYERHDWPFVADRRNFLNRPKFYYDQHDCHDWQRATDCYRSWEIAAHPNRVGLVQGWSRSPRFISTIRCDLSHFVRIWCDDHDWQLIVLIVEIFWTVQNYSTINKIATTDLKIW